MTMTTATTPDAVKLPADVRLGPDERPVFMLRTHPKILFVPAVLWLFWVAASVLTWMFVPRDLGEGWVHTGAQAVTFLLALHYTWWPVLQWWKRIYIVTTKQILIREGVLYKKSLSSQIARVADIHVERGILDRIFRCGTLVIVNSANGDAVSDANRIIFRDVPRALEVEQALKDMVYTTRSAPGQW